MRAFETNNEYKRVVAVVLLALLVYLKILFLGFNHV